MDLGSLAQYVQLNITNLGVKIDADLKLESQVRAGVRSSLFHLRQLAKNKTYFIKDAF